MSFRRIAGIAGVIFVVLLVVQVVIGGDEPAPGDDIADVVEYFQDDAGLQEFSVGAGAVGTLLFPLFLQDFLDLLFLVFSTRLGLD